ncbi:MAG: hypothetical protein ONA90_05555 [candidate division KSB1 bacterium]|nr:hypothetical protein [candidate division KSB1 bacterium]
MQVGKIILAQGEHEKNRQGIVIFDFGDLLDKLLPGLLFVFKDNEKFFELVDEDDQRLEAGGWRLATPAGVTDNWSLITED